MSVKNPPCEYEDVLEFYGESKRESLTRSLSLVNLLMKRLKTNESAEYLNRQLIPVTYELSRQLSHCTERVSV